MGAGGQPERVSVHDFADEELGKAVPYGIYDLTANTGWVNVGTDHDTGAFAVAWLDPQLVEAIGQAAYPGGRRLLITADSGGSNGSRLRVWKTELAAFAGRSRPGHHRAAPATGNEQMERNRTPAVLRDHSMNWRGRPLVSHEVIIGRSARSPPGPA